MDKLYIILFLLAVVILILLLGMYSSHISPLYAVLFTAVALENFGSMQLASAKEITTAIYANQTIYLGACCTPFLLLLCIADLCKVRIPIVVRRATLITCCFVFFMVSSIGVYPWYYKSVNIAEYKGVTYLVKEYGPLHIVYPIYLIALVITAIVVIVKALRNSKGVSYITCFWLIAIMISTSAVYLGEKAINLPFDLLPVAYVIAEIIILFLLSRIRLYDISRISTDSMVDSSEHGFVLFDSKGRYLGSDKAAKAWFPELTEQFIDKEFTRVDTPLFKNIRKWIDIKADHEEVLINVNDSVIEAHHHMVKESFINSVHCVYLRDDTKHQQYMSLVEKYNENLERDVNEKTQKLKQIQSDIIISMASIVENRDNNTGGHIVRTSDVVKIFVKHLRKKGVLHELTPKMAECIIKAAPLHDFGKIGVPDEVLNKKGRFTPEEYETMKKHSAKGAILVDQILKNSEDREFRDIAVNVAHFHHEKWDGNGYPDGLSGEQIPLEARIMALADVFDALVSKRVYKESYSYDKAFGIIEESCGSHFDPVLCKEFMECREQLEALFDSYETQEA